ncbi:MAG: hypothetical protein GTO05_15175, partial [Gemmatimonadales bacterium]|nr:hypothetical protein [Gemmatimonadales bacterium]NIS66470.1 hypothetical protein [Gemmatimonadales bacterium]
TTDRGKEVGGDQGHVLASRLGGFGWALFFVWIGVALLATFPAAVTLLGVGAITLGVQVARKSVGLSLEVFWVIVGLLFV